MGVYEGFTYGRIYSGTLTRSSTPLKGIEQWISPAYDVANRAGHTLVYNYHDPGMLPKDFWSTDYGENSVYAILSDSSHWGGNKDNGYNGSRCSTVENTLILPSNINTLVVATASDLDDFYIYDKTVNEYIFHGNNIVVEYRNAQQLLQRRRMLMQQSASVDPYLLLPFTITVTTSSTQIYVRSTGSSDPPEVPGLLTSVFFNKNNTGWQEFTYDVDEGLFVSNGSYTIPVEAGDVVLVKGNGPWSKGNAQLAFNVVGTYNSTDARFNLSGNIMSLLYSDNFETATVVPNGGLTSIFYAGQLAPILYCIVDASKLRFPATEVGNGGYRYMFNQCVNMVSAPEIISAMTMGTFACHLMFYNCVHLVNSPKELPAINMTNSCYNQMFRNCSRMTTAPDIPNVNWGTATNPMNGMFRGCSSLSKIKAMFTELPSDRTVINGWLNGVDTSGTFIKNINATWDVTGDSGVPEGWTIQYASS